MIMEDGPSPALNAPELLASMILSSSNYPFHGAVSELMWPDGFVRISTAKDGFFSKQSTMISVIPFPAAPVTLNRVVAKVMWADALRSPDRQKCHHVFVTDLSDIADELAKTEVHPEALLLALEHVVAGFRNRGMIKEFIHQL